MRGHALIQVQDCVGLGAAARTVARQVPKATPLPLVRCHERAQIHAHTVCAAAHGYAGPIMSSSTVGVDVDDLVTGEAVALELPAAGIAIRALSGFLDLLIASLALWVGLIVTILITQNADDAIVGVAMTVLVALASVVLPTTLETLTRGRSVGKLATGLRTVRDDAGPIGFRHALTRALVGFVELWVLFGVPALVSGLMSNKGKRLGDYAAASDDASPAGCMGGRRGHRPAA